MTRMVFGCTLALLLTAAAGCRMCAHPHDYHGPVWNGANGDPVARAGSVLAPAGGSIAGPIMPATMIQSPGETLPAAQVPAIPEAGNGNGADAAMAPAPAPPTPQDWTPTGAPSEN